MSVLGRVLIGSQQRLDLADVLAQDSYTASDFKHLIKSFIGDAPLVLKGFDLIDAPSSIGTTSVSIRVADSVLYSPTSSAGSFFYGLPEGQDLSAPLVPELRLGTNLVPTINYVYVTLSTVGRGQDTRAFWDVNLNGGEGGEFNQDVNTESVLIAQVGVSVSTFPEGSIPIAKVKMNASVITEITDCRNMMFRLGTGGASPNPNNTYSFRSLPSTGFDRDEPSITISSGSSPNPFFGGDKNFYNLKEWMDVVMTKLLELSGTTFWYESTPTMSILNLFSDALGSNVKSKGRWTHDLATPGKITWSEDILIRKMNDPRDLIVRANATTGVTLSDDQVMWIELVRDAQINPTDTPVTFQTGVNYVNGAAGIFASLKKGDWIKRHGDDDNLYLRVEDFNDGLSLGGASGATPANALSIKLSSNYAGPNAADPAVYTKGEYLNTDIQVSNRADTSPFVAGGNFYWLANRSDTIQSISSIVPTVFSGTVDVSDSDGVRAKLTFPSAHNLVDGDRVVVAGAGSYNGTYQVEVDSATAVFIDTTATANPFGVSVSWSIVTTAARSTSDGYQLESANHNFESNQTIAIAGTSTLYDSYQSGKYTINYRSATTFQIPYDTNTSVGATGTASGARVNLKTEFGSARVIQGESIDINEPDTVNILKFMGMESLTQTSPVYQTPSGYNTLAGFENFNSDAGDNLTVRVSRLTAMMADRVQDRGLKILGRGVFRNEGSGANQITSVSGSLFIEKPGSPQQSITLSSFTLAANQALVATISRDGSSAIVPVVESLGSPFLLEENKIILFYRFSGTSIYSWDGHEINNSSSWTSNDYETSQNKNIIVQDFAGISYDNLNDVIYYNSSLEDVYVIIPGSADNIIDTSEINSLPALSRTVTENQSVWIRINRSVQKWFTTTETSATAQDSDVAGALYITATSSVPTDQDVIVLYSVRNNLLIKHQHFNPAGSIYEENKVGTLLPADSYEFTAPLIAPQIISLPLDSREASSLQFYVVGSGQLQVFLNGQRLRESEDYSEVGSIGGLSTQIQIEQDLVVDDVLTFRIDGNSAVYFAAIPPSSATLQNAYDNSNTISVVSGSPVTIIGPPATKLLNILGDITVTGVIDPKGITFALEASNPLPALENGLWVDSNGNLRQWRPGFPDEDINITESILSNSSTIILSNSSGSTIAALKPVRIDSNGDLAPIDVTVESQAKAIVGITVAPILNAASGSVVISGKIENITGAFAFGDTLYLDKNGNISNITPDIGAGSPAFAPGDFVVKLGVVARNQAVPINKDLILQIQVIGQLQ